MSKTIPTFKVDLKLMSRRFMKLAVQGHTILLPKANNNASTRSLIVTINNQEREIRSTKHTYNGRSLRMSCISRNRAEAIASPQSSNPHHGGDLQQY